MREGNDAGPRNSSPEGRSISLDRINDELAQAARREPEFEEIAAKLLAAIRGNAVADCCEQLRRARAVLEAAMQRREAGFNRDASAALDLLDQSDRQREATA